tara:strand:- start:418 stop:606 length:189 start_codon:yes stop_codon:yes gene_type:complete
MNKDSWIALIIAGTITILVATPLYYSRGSIGSKERLSEGSGSKAIEPMQRSNDSSPATNMDK